MRGLPGNSVGAGGAATTCTCAANYWAKKSGSTWSCELCSGQRTKDATSTVPGSGSSEDDDAVCVDATSCDANHYLSGGECVSCPTFDDKESTSASASSTTCTCPAGYYADKTTSCKACPVGSSRTGSTIFGDSEKEDDSVCVANCASGKYWDGDSCEDCPATLSAPAGRRRRARAMRTTGPRSQAAPGRASSCSGQKNQGCDLDGSRFRQKRG